MAGAVRPSAHLRLMDAAAPNPSTAIVPSWEAHVVHWALRLGAAGCYVGHGAFGIITKAAWLPYFAVVGIPEGVAWRLMPIIGTGDITLGILTLIRPMPVVLLYMAVWG